MTNIGQVLLRSRDVGFALASADRYGVRLNRIRLQKFVYLLDCVSGLYDSFPLLRGHYTYKYGPYDISVQNAVDMLAFRGFVQIWGANRQFSSKPVADYSLTTDGGDWVEKVACREAFRLRWQAAVDISGMVEQLGWHRLKELVYAEPTYLSSKSSGFGKILKPDNRLETSASHLISLIDSSLRSGFKDVKPQRQLLLELFFDYLVHYSSQNRESK